MATRAMSGQGRRTVAETRQLLLRAAVDLLRERADEAGDHVVAAALAHVRFTQVADRATALVRADTHSHAPAVTTGAIYNLWATQADFQVDLLLHVADLQAALVPGLEASVLRFRQAREQSVPLDDVLRGLADEIERHYRQDPIFRVELGFLIGACDARVQSALARRQEVFFASADRAWESLLDTYGLRLRPSFQIRDLTTAAAACLIGFTVLSFANSPADTDPGDTEWSLTARTIKAVFDTFTE